MKKAILLEHKKSYNPRDPYLFYHEGFYYHLFSYNCSIYIKKSKTIKELIKKEPIKIYTPLDNKYNKDVWAPELHIINNKCYIYVAIDDGDNYHHRMFVLYNNSNDPVKPFINKGIISDDTNCWAIDGTVVQFKNNLYFVWSGWPDEHNIVQNIYIAHMKDPFTIDSKRVMISTPTYAWEKIGCTGIEKDNKPLVNEGPFPFYLNDKVYIIFSASGCWGNGYCLGLLECNSDNLLDYKSWKKYPDPILKSNDFAKGPGHASFLQNSPDKKLYIAYHAFTEINQNIWGNTYACVQEIKIKDNLPFIGEPAQEIE